jgi:hypothetical protein
MPRTSTMSVQAALQLPRYDDVHHGTHLTDNPKPATLGKMSYSSGVLLDRETFDSLLGGWEALSDSPKYVLPWRAAELLSSGELSYGLMLESYATMPFTIASR